MCSVQEEGDVNPESKSAILKGQACKKCEKQAVVLTKIKDTYCRECFLTYCVHKLRSAFGKSRVVRDGDVVLLAFSGGAASTALLHLVQEAKSERTQRKLRFTPALVYIDERAVLGDKFSESNPSWSIMEKMVASQRPSYYYRIEQVFDREILEQKVPASLEDYLASLSLHTENQEKLKTMLNGTKSLTAKESLLHSLRHHLLIRIAGAVGHSKVLIGDSASRLAVRLLADITQGRGAHTALNMAFHDNRHTEVSFLRPLREFTSKEITMYNRMNNLEPVIVPTLSTMASTSASLGRVTEDFVTGLQAGYPNTVSTICRTGEKMALSSASNTDAAPSCSLCHAPLDTIQQADACTAMAAIAFSQFLSNKQSANQNAGNRVSSVSTNGGCCQTDEATNGSCCKNAESTNEKAECCGEGDGSCKTTSSKQIQLSTEDLNESLCYGCRLIVRDMANVRDLPVSVHEDAARNKRRCEMKASINEFLLDD